MNRYLRAVLVAHLLLACLALAAPRARESAAAPASPPATSSLYITTLDEGTNYSYGCNQGNALPDGFEGAVVLAFGQPWSQNGAYGANIFDHDGTFHTVDEIADAVRWYAYGFWDCTHTRPSGPHLRIIIGSSNFDGKYHQYDNVNAQHGTAWANMVKDVWTWAQSQAGYADRFTIGAGNDMEVGWAGPARTRDWIAGYQSAPAHLPYYDFGDCAGCPESTNPNAQPAPYSLQDIFYKAYGAEAANPLPEIYATNGVNAQQWWFVAQTAYNNGWGAMTFRGAMTQRGDCDQKRVPGYDPCADAQTDNPPAQGWAFLWDALHQQGSTLGAINPLPWSTDIRY